jgi:hypothetical protein
MDDIIKIGLGMLVMTGFPLILYGGFVGIRAWQRRVEGHTGGDDMKRELEDLRARVADLEQVQGRVEEMEERLDFTERVIAREKKIPLIQGD